MRVKLAILLLTMSIDVYINDTQISATSLIYDVENNIVEIKTDELFKNGLNYDR